MAARKPGLEPSKGFEELVTGSWRLVFGNPQLEPPLIDRAAYVFCILEALHSALRRREVYAVGADKWGNPRARLIEERLWVRERPTVLTALGPTGWSTSPARTCAATTSTSPWPLSPSPGHATSAWCQ